MVTIYNDIIATGAGMFHATDTRSGNNGSGSDGGDERDLEGSGCDGSRLDDDEEDEDEDDEGAEVCLLNLHHLYITELAAGCDHYQHYPCFICL
jgi:hypothetical protein